MAPWDGALSRTTRPRRETFQGPPCLLESESLTWQLTAATGPALGLSSPLPPSPTRISLSHPGPGVGIPNPLGYKTLDSCETRSVEQDPSGRPQRADTPLSCPECQPQAAVPLRPSPSCLHCEQAFGGRRESSSLVFWKSPPPSALSFCLPPSSPSPRKSNSQALR